MIIRVAVIPAMAVFTFGRPQLTLIAIYLLNSIPGATLRLLIDIANLHGATALAPALNLFLQAKSSHFKSRQPFGRQAV